MSLSVALYGATGAVGSAFLSHLLNARLLKGGARVTLVGRGTEESRAKLAAMRVDLLDAFDDAELEIDIVGTLDSVEADLVIMAAGVPASPKIKARRDFADANAPLLRDAARRLS